MLVGLASGCASADSTAEETGDQAALAKGAATLRASSEFDLDSYQGKVVVVNFWATWCVPCRVEMPSMKRLEKNLKYKPFVIVTVNLQESSEKIKKFYQNLKLTFDTLLDPDGKIFKLYNASQLPTTYIIDKQGFMVAKAVGPREWDSEESIGYIIHLAT